MSFFDVFYGKYIGSFDGFKQFHNEVINMPRDAFSDSGIDKVRLLAGYLLLTEGKTSEDGNNYKEIMGIVSEEIKNDIFPHYRDNELENRYFIFDNIDYHYSVEGRMFRHLMSLCDFFGFIDSMSKQKKIINYDKCREYYLSNNDILMPIARNNLMMLNAGTNNFIKSLKGISITEDTDYRPTYAILRYIEAIKRPVTKFELSFLLGRVDDLKNENEILERATKIGSILPSTQLDQIAFVFENMGWKTEDGMYFRYAASQEPDFKFNNYLLFMEAFELLKWSSISETYILTDYSIQLLQDDVSYLIADLEKLINLVDDYESQNKELNDLILYQRNPELLRLAKEDSSFIQKMNLRSIKRPYIDQNTGKRKRNRLIAELAKIQVDYICQYEGKHMFKMPSGKYYCEAHHILEFSTEDGPDITNNLVVLGPFAHMVIHHACKDEVDDVFLTLVKNSAIKYSQFEEMITVYNCLSSEQIEILKNRKVLTSSESEKLKALIA